jgi:hypothetical protein
LHFVKKSMLKRARTREAYEELITRVLVATRIIKDKILDIDQMMKIHSYYI